MMSSIIKNKILLLSISIRYMQVAFLTGRELIGLLIRGWDPREAINFTTFSCWHYPWSPIYLERKLDSEGDPM